MGYHSTSLPTLTHHGAVSARVPHSFRSALNNSPKQPRIRVASSVLLSSSWAPTPFPQRRNKVHDGDLVILQKLHHFRTQQGTVIAVDGSSFGADIRAPPLGSFSWKVNYQQFANPIHLVRVYALMDHMRSGSIGLLRCPTRSVIYLTLHRVEGHVSNSNLR